MTVEEARKELEKAWGKQLYCEIKSIKATREYNKAWLDWKKAMGEREDKSFACETGR